MWAGHPDCETGLQHGFTENYADIKGSTNSGERERIQLVMLMKHLGKPLSQLKPQAISFPFSLFLINPDLFLNA